MATSEAKELLDKYERQRATENGPEAPVYERELFKKGGSIGVTLTATGRDVHGLTADMSADVFVFGEGIIVIPGGRDDE